MSISHPPSKRAGVPAMWPHRLSLISAVTSILGAALPAWACDGPAAKLVSQEGVVEVRGVGQLDWQAAKPEQILCTGDTLAVRHLSRAAVVLPNEVVLRLDQGSVLTLSLFAHDQASELGLLKGALHVLTRFSKRFGVKTPYLNAMVDGTEFTVKVDDIATRVTVTEGQVRAENELGQQQLTAGSSASAGTLQAPQTLTLKPDDAVQWALYFPQIVRVPTVAMEALPEPARNAVRLASVGQFSAALQAWPTELPTLRAARAGWLLALGRVDEAESIVLPDETSADTLAIRSVIHVVRNQAAQALSTAQAALELAPQQASPYLALSYARQALRDLPAALAAAQQAVDIDREHALAWARLAELQLSSGLLGDGQASAQRSWSLNAHTPRAQALLGFSQLLRGKLAQASDTFTAAQTAYPADPLPHVGLGLLKLRSGQTSEGRREIEIAVMLDPGNAELRATLARAYLMEERNPLATTQVQVALALDPLSPTPWFIDGLRKQREYRPVEAAGDYEQALRLNQQRAVVRPNSLLDTDRAARTAALAAVWRDLGFDGALLSAARSALTDDPQSEAAHRLLAEAYAVSPRTENARVSELLQAQLRQSPRTEPVAPQELLPGLPVLNGPRALSLQETSAFFDERLGGARIGLAGGNRGLWGTSATVWRGVGDGQISVGHFHYETDGFREGANLTLNANNVLWQTQVTPEVSTQIEWRHTRRNGGDITQRILPDSSAPQRQRSFDSTASRVGVRYAPGPDTEWLGSVVHIDRDATTVDVTRIGPATFTGKVSSRRSALLSEIMHSSRFENLRGSFGVSNYREDQERLLITSVTGLPFAQPPRINNDSPPLQHDHAFAYGDLGIEPVTIHVGIGRDDFKVAPIEVHALTPKLGATWKASETLRLQLALLRSVKGSATKEQTIEPTQFAGFNQLFDDADGTKSQIAAMAITQQLSAFEWRFEVMQRKLGVPTAPTSQIPICTQSACEVQWDEMFKRLNWSHRIAAQWAWSGSIFHERQALKTLGSITNIPSRISTGQMNLRASYFDPTGWSVYGQARRVQQSADFTSGAVRQASEKFWLADTGLRWEISKHTSLMFEISNLLNRNFQYQDTYLSGNPRVPMFQPGRTLIGRLEVRL